MELLFLAIGLLLATAAAYLQWSDPGHDYVFPLIILAICSGFLSYRARIKARTISRKDG